MYKRTTQGWLGHWGFILMDLASLHAAWILAYMARHGPRSPYSDDSYVSLCFVFMLTDLAASLYLGTMRDAEKRGWRQELVMTARHVALATLTAVFYLFSVHSIGQYSRIFFYVMAASYGALSYGTRMLLKAAIRRRKPADGGKPVYLVAGSDNAESAVRTLSGAHAGRIVGMAVTDRDIRGQEILGVPVVARPQDIAGSILREWVEEAYVAVPLEDPSLAGILETFLDMGVVTHVPLPQVRMDGGAEQFVEEFGGGLALTTSIRSVSMGQAFLKRSMDILGGLVGSAVACVLYVILGPMIRHASPGPVIFTQVRVGKNGKKFKMYKFRSMHMNSDEKKAELARAEGIEDQMMFKLDWDPRIIGSKVLPDGTRKKGIGNYIREWSLDEFPQFFNVLKGDMSLVGTRPPTVDEWERYEPHHRARLSTRPGITGLWQVSGRSQITDFEEVVQLDKKYIREWSIGLDIKILLQTVRVLLKRDGAM